MKALRKPLLILIVFLISMMVPLITGCGAKGIFVTNNIDKLDMNKAAWLVYWDLDSGEKDLVKLGKKMGKLSYFCAYFDELDRLFVPSGIVDAATIHKGRKLQAETYLSFVNDKRRMDGTFVLKDLEVLRRWLSKEDLMDKHIDDIIEITKKMDLDGVEIDYERVWKDEAIGKLFLRFVDKLYSRARDNKLKVRVVLEPNTPFTTSAFTKGPEYVVMFYNLYGLHSGPGPKANKSFILKVLKQMENLPGEKAAAFSMGGSLWGSNGKKQLITEQEAKALASAHNVVPVRDEESQSLFFEYVNEEVRYQVWYADITTLNYWSSIVKAQGVNKVNLWRLGGNIDINKMN